MVRLKRRLRRNIFERSTERPLYLFVFVVSFRRVGVSMNMNILSAAAPSAHAPAAECFQLLARLSGLRGSVFVYPGDGEPVNSRKLTREMVETGRCL